MVTSSHSSLSTELSQQILGDSPPETLHDRHAAEALWLLGELCGELIKVTDLEALQDLLSQKIRWVLDFDRCTLAVRVESSFLGQTLPSLDLVYLLVELSSPRKAKATPAQICLLHEGWSGRVLMESKPYIVPDLRALPDDISANLPYAQFEIAENARSLLLLPLRSGNLTIGSLNFSACKPNTYTIVRRNLASLLANQLSGQLSSIFAHQRTEAALVALEEARQAAEKASRLKSTFLATMSHEIRTPMNAVLGMTELLLHTKLSPEQHELAQTVQTSGQSLLTLINEILDFSKLDAGEMQLECLDFDLRHCLETVLDLFAANAYRKGLELCVLLPPELPSQLRGDPNRLRQVFANLVSNAIKFTAKGEVTIVASLESETDTQVCYRFAVRDTGDGVAPEAQTKLFQAFSQADASITRKYGGTGLGLAICRQLVNLMQGEIGIISSLGNGSEFWFTADFEKQPEQTVPGPCPRDLGPVQLLVIDDNLSHCQMVCQQATVLGIVAEATCSLTEGLQRLRDRATQANPIEVVLANSHLPNVAKQGFSQTLQQDTQLARVKIVWMIPIDHYSQTLEKSQPEATAHLMKPIKQVRLYDCLKGLLGENYSLASEAATIAPTPTEPASPPALSHLKLLLAEDNPINQKLILMQLKTLGCTADVANNGQEAFDRTCQTDYDIVFMDYQMPEMDGCTATQLLRERETTLQQQNGSELHRTIVIAMTASAMEEDREACFAAGMDDYVTKPISKKVLEEVLYKWSQRAVVKGAHPEFGGVQTDSRDDILHEKR
jgi:signal transduction histidine kinase/DNA-binding response OmpR family regulator